MQLNGKSALVTGAASGIGAEIARVFAAAGAKVCIADLNEEQAKKTASTLKNSIGVRMDVTSEDEVERGVAEMVRELGGVDILVSNAGVQHIDNIADVSFENWRKVIAIHLDGGFLTTRACMRQMIEQKRGGSILLMGSVHSKEASPQKGPYVAAKHGLVGLCRVVAKEGAAHGIRSNLICPGFVRTPLVEIQIEDQARIHGVSKEQAIRDYILAPQPTKEFVKLEEIAAVALFLAGEGAAQINGASISVDGGWTAR